MSNILSTIQKCASCRLKNSEIDTGLASCRTVQVQSHIIVLRNITLLNFKRIYLLDVFKASPVGRAHMVEFMPLINYISIVGIRNIAAQVIKAIHLFQDNVINRYLYPGRLSSRRSHTSFLFEHIRSVLYVLYTAYLHCDKCTLLMKQLNQLSTYNLL